ncbi:MAG: SPOR domain-containing protein [Candidatus Polarisedimenticolaceae bacterium]|nr:SPOR domain-containing protein [Candidatus Polarisedimenticolaceae bacterium]
MDEKLKQRLVGAAVLVILMVIFIPILVEDKGMLATDPASMKAPPWPEQKRPTVTPNTDGSPTKLPIPDLVKERSETAPPVVVKREERAKQKIAPSVKQKKGSSWVVQAGSFSSKKNTDQLVKKLIKKGLPAYYESVAVKGKKLYRVRIGRDLEKKVAEKYIKQLKRDFKLTGKLQSSP